MLSYVVWNLRQSCLSHLDDVRWATENMKLDEKVKKQSQVILFFIKYMLSVRIHTKNLF